MYIYSILSGTPYSKNLIVKCNWGISWSNFRTTFDIVGALTWIALQFLMFWGSMYLSIFLTIYLSRKWKVNGIIRRVYRSRCCLWDVSMKVRYRNNSFDSDLVLANEIINYLRIKIYQKTSHSIIVSLVYKYGLFFKYFYVYYYSLSITHSKK